MYLSKLANTEYLIKSLFNNPFTHNQHGKQEYGSVKNEEAGP